MNLEISQPIPVQETEKTAIANRPIFICYRQIDGKRYARWIYSALKQALESRNDTREIYFDQTAPSKSDWTSIHGAALQRAGSMIVICTPGLAADQGPDDWVQREIDWWLNNRKAAPILIDVTGEGLRWVPAKLRNRWPNAQRVNVDNELWANANDQEQAVLASQVAEQILGGISGSQFEVVQQDLAATRRVNRWLKGLTGALIIFFLVAAVLGFYANRLRRVANQNLATALEQQRVANQNLSTALAERALRVGREDYSLGLLLTAEALRYADSFEARNAVITLLQLNPTVKRFFPGTTEILLNPNGTNFIDGELNVWDVGSGRQTTHLPLDRSSSPLAFRSDGRVAAFCVSKDSDDKSLLEILDVTNNQVLASFEIDECFGAKAVFSPSGQEVILGSESKLHTWNLHIWNLQTRQETVTPLKDWTDEDIIFDSQGRLAASLRNKSGTLTVWDVKTGKILGSATEHKARVTSVAFSDDSTLLASADETGVVIVWSLQPRMAKIKSLKHYEGVASLAFTPDNLKLAAGGSTTIGGLANFGENVHRISIWNLKTGEPDSSILELHCPVWSLHFIDGGRELLAGGAEETRLLEVPESVVPPATQQNVVASVSERKLAKASDQIIASIDQKVLTVWSRLNKQPPLKYQIPADIEPVSLAVHDSLTAVGGKNGSLLLADPSHGSLRLIGTHPAEPSVLAFSTDGKLLGVAAQHGTVSLWNVEQNTRLWTQELSPEVQAITVAANGTVAAGGTLSDLSEGFLFLLTDAGPPREIKGFENLGVSALAFSLDGATLAVGSSEIFLVDVKTFAPSKGLSHGERAGNNFFGIGPNALAFSPDGKLLLSGAGDGRVRIFDVLALTPLGNGFVVPGAPNNAADALKERGQPRVEFSQVMLEQDRTVAAIVNGSFVQWRLGPMEALREHACEIANRSFTKEEWQELFPATPYSVTCANAAAPNKPRIAVLTN